MATNNVAYSVMTSNLEQLSFFERRLSLNLSEKSLAIRAKETGRVDSSVSPLVGEIGRGILLLLGGVHREDTEDAADLLAAKCAELRIFPDEQGKMNLSAKEIDAHALVVSQFTLYGDCHKGRRPNYMAAAGPENATELYDYFVAALRRHVSRVETGVFGAVMQVELVNDGPVTLILER